MAGIREIETEKKQNPPVGLFTGQTGHPTFFVIELCSFYGTGTQTSCADMHSFSSSVYFAFYILDIRTPNFIGSSMGMAYVVTKMNAFATNITFSHLRTS